MTATERRNRKFLADLFAGPFRGHGIIMSPPPILISEVGDFTISDRPMQEWVPWVVKGYEDQVAWLEALHDDSVPYVKLDTNSGIFAAAFGCRIHVYAGNENPAALPLITTAEEADHLPEPSLNAPTLARVFELARLVRREVGPGVPISVPDIQSPLDTAALIWRKQDLFVAMIENPAAVKRLVGKCLRLLKLFLTEFKREFPECNLCHCPIAWAPPELGCWLAEDEVGSISTRMFEEFSLPELVDLSETFGGLFIHCCANADHQYGGFKKIPNLRGLNRVFQAPGPRPAIEAFSGQTVLTMAWIGEETVQAMLDMAQPNTRFLFNMSRASTSSTEYLSLEKAKPPYERLRARCPSQEPD
jgi:hypothetical protein